MSQIQIFEKSFFWYKHRRVRKLKLEKRCSKYCFKTSSLCGEKDIGQYLEEVMFQIHC